MNISSIRAFQIYDSRGTPTIEAEVTLENGLRGSGIAPSGASTGQYEALELRDGERGRFRGKSVFKAIAHIHEEIAPALVGRDVLDQRGIDRLLVELDGTPNKSRLGANAIVAVSMGVAKAGAAAKNQPIYESLGNGNLLPLPEIQIIGGGAHANWRTDVQDILIIATGARSYAEVMEMTYNVYQAAAELMKQSGRYYGVADEGGLWPEFQTNEEALAFVVEAIRKAGYTPGREISLSIDVAASDLFDAERGCYQFRLEKREFTSREFAALIIDWCDRYPIVSIEDPMSDTDWDGWDCVAKALRHRVQLVGDDLLATNIQRIKAGIERGAANSVLIKPNQIGTVTETIDAIRLTRDAGWLPIVSARSGETEDTFIAHLAVATNAGQLKVGSFTRGERMAKWNEVIRIERALGSRGRFLGSGIFDQLKTPITQK